MELSYLEVKNTIEKFAEENSLTITQNQIKEINDVYNLIKGENININKNKFETESLITMITQDVISSSYNRKKTMLMHSDFRHMGYFDRWFREGTSEDITEILNSYGISTDIFKGIPRLQNFKTNQVVNGYNIEIIQTADDESPPNANIKIKIDGETVYDFEKEINKPKTKYDDNDYYYEEPSLYTEMKSSKKYNKSYVEVENELRKMNKKKPVENIFETNGNTIYQTSYIRQFKSGKKAIIKQFRYSNGKFASKADRMNILEDFYG